MPYYKKVKKDVSLHQNFNSSDATDMASSPQIALLEDHPVYRCGLKLTLAPIYHVALEADSASSFFEQLESKHIDVLILDLILPDLSGIEVARIVKETYPEIKILVLSVDSREESVRELMQIGIDGFLCKSSSEKKLHEAMQALLNGKPYFERPEEILERDVLISRKDQALTQLTAREHDIMLALCKGMSCNEISAKMFISPKTVDNHKQHIFSKLGIHNTVELVTYAIKNKIILL